MSVKIKRAMFCTIDASKLDVLEQDFQDNLRYDVAFVSTKDRGRVAFPTFQSRHGNLGGEPSGRWSRMFNLRKDETIAPFQGASILYEAQDEWVTYRHPMIGDRPDYAKLAPMTLRQFIIEKSAEDKRR